MPNSDPQKRNAYQNEWMRRNPDRWRELSREAMKRWRKRHPEIFAARRKAYFAEHPEVKRGIDERYRAAHPEIRKVIYERYRARRQAAEGAFTHAEWIALVEAYGGRCAYCGRRGVPLQVEHRVPTVTQRHELYLEHRPRLRVLQCEEACDGRGRLQVQVPLHDHVNR